ALHQPLTGWMGHAEPFAFTDDYAPAAGIDRLLTGTPPILGLAALEEGVRLIVDAGIERLVAKSRALSGFLHRCIAEAVPSPLQGRGGSAAGAEGEGEVALRPPLPTLSPQGERA